jgi:hypothetical protein
MSIITKQKIKSAQMFLLILFLNISNGFSALLDVVSSEITKNI